jgi:hypothetical protein
MRLEGAEVTMTGLFFCVEYCHEQMTLLTKCVLEFSQQLNYSIPLQANGLFSLHEKDVFGSQFVFFGEINLAENKSGI